VVEENGTMAGGAVPSGWPGRRPGMVVGVVRVARRPGIWPAVVVMAVAVAGLLAGCSVTASEQGEAIPRALVAADGRYVVVPVTAGGCVRRSVLSAAETASQVTLVLTQYLEGNVCPADLSFGTAAVTLRHPLWGRSLVDGTTRRAIPYFDGRKLLRVSYLPPGYRFSDYFTGVFTGWEQEFSSPGRRDTVLDVEQVPGSRPASPSWPAVSRGTVRGHPATVGVNSANGQVFGRSVSWQANGYTFVVFTMVMQDGQRLLPTGELMRVASGLRS
jgi:hypothetical protein